MNTKPQDTKPQDTKPQDTKPQDTKPQSLEGIEACVFDAYGTLFDVASAVKSCQDLLGDKAEALNVLWRSKQIEYTWLRSLMGTYEDFWRVTGDALDYALESLEIDDADLRHKLMDLYLRLAPFPEAKQVLERLRDAGLRLAILSNGSPRMLGAAVENADLGPLLEAVISVDDIGIYKPHPSVYQRAVDTLGVEATRICFLTSNGFDVYGAAAFGLRVVWVNRYGQRPERLPGTPAREIQGLAGLPGLLVGRPPG